MPVKNRNSPKTRRAKLSVVVIRIPPITESAIPMTYANGASSPAIKTKKNSMIGFILAMDKGQFYFKYEMNIN